MAKNNWVCSAEFTCPGPFRVWRTPNDHDRHADSATCDVHARPAWRAIFRADRRRLGLSVWAAQKYVSRTGPHAREIAAALRVPLVDGPPEHRGNGIAPYYYSDDYLERYSGVNPDPEERYAGLPAEPGNRAAYKVANRAEWARVREQERRERRLAKFLVGLEASAERSSKDERSLSALADEWIASERT